MTYARTTLRLRTDLKRAAEERALKESTSLQAIFNKALEEHLQRAAKREVRLVFRTHSLGTPLDNLTRDDYYDEPPTHTR